MHTCTHQHEGCSRGLRHAHAHSGLGGDLVSVPLIGTASEAAWTGLITATVRVTGNVQVQYASLPNYEDREEEFVAESVLLRRRFAEDGQCPAATWPVLDMIAPAQSGAGSPVSPALPTKQGLFTTTDCEHTHHLWVPLWCQADVDSN